MKTIREITRAMLNAQGLQQALAMDLRHARAGRYVPDAQQLQSLASAAAYVGATSADCAAALRLRPSANDCRITPERA